MLAAQSMPDPEASQLAYWPSVLGAYAGGFVIGYLLRYLPFRDSMVFQSFFAWMSMIAMAMLFAQIIIQAFINPTLHDKLDLRTWEAIVVAVTACYFGKRS